MHPVHLTGRPVMPGASRTAAAPARSGQAGGADVAAEQGTCGARGAAGGSQAGCIQPPGAEDRCRELAGRLSGCGVVCMPQLGLQHSRLCVQNSIPLIENATNQKTTRPAIVGQICLAQHHRQQHLRNLHLRSLQKQQIYTCRSCGPPTACSRSHNSGGGRCVGSRPKRFFRMTRSRENLSSGEKRAGCAECVGVPSGAVFCTHKQLHQVWLEACVSAHGHHPSK